MLTEASEQGGYNEIGSRKGSLSSPTPQSMIKQKELLRQI